MSQLSPTCEEIISEIAADPIDFMLGWVYVAGVFFAIIFGVPWAAYALGVAQ